MASNVVYAVYSDESHETEVGGGEFALDEDGKISTPHAGTYYVVATFTAVEGYTITNEDDKTSYSIVMNPEEIALSLTPIDPDGTEVAIGDMDAEIVADYFEVLPDTMGTADVDWLWCATEDGNYGEFDTIFEDASVGDTGYVKITKDASDDGLTTYTESDTLTVTAEAVAIAADDITLTGSSSAYTGVAQEPAVTVSVGGNNLTEGTDYDVSYKSGDSKVEEMIDAGEYTVVVTGKGKYKGSPTKTFTITKVALTVGDLNATSKNVTEAGDVVLTDEITGVGFTGLVNNEEMTLGTDYQFAFACTPTQEANSYDADTKTVAVEESEEISVTVTVNIVAAGDVAKNYTFADEEKTFTINAEIE